MDFEGCLTLFSFSHFISLCYSQSISSKLLSSKEKGKKIPGALEGTKGGYFAPYTEPGQWRESRDEQDGAGWPSKRKGFQKRRVKQTECLQSETGEEGEFGKLVLEDEHREGLR